MEPVHPGHATLLVLSRTVHGSRVGAPTFLGGILVVWGAVTLLFAFMRTARQFYALRLLLGVAESGAYPGAPLAGCLHADLCHPMPYYPGALPGRVPPGRSLQAGVLRLCAVRGIRKECRRAPAQVPAWPDASRTITATRRPLSVCRSW